MSTPQRVLVLFAHPALHKSRTNRKLIEGVEALDGITFHDLYEAYPYLHIDVAAEQALLLEHDIVVFHFPFYWYSTPAILKEWQDLVLEHGWAYGHTGNALRGKRLLCVTTTGGREDAYQPDGHNRFTMRQLLAPLEATANLCGMGFLPPFVVHGTHLLDEDAMEHHHSDYRRILLALRDGRIDPERASLFPRLNTDLEAIFVDEEG
ncbi:MAG: NAD(P)H-dependent oxidoreductase [Deltaproteobacteria bacterium]|nr:NAD(P)H-dependent oxidoreductase [Deltaproteobacteria bacterium]